MLGNDIPDMYLTLDVVPNAYTYGDTKPFIVWPHRPRRTLYQSFWL